MSSVHVVLVKLWTNLIAKMEQKEAKYIFKPWLLQILNI